MLFRRCLFLYSVLSRKCFFFWSKNKIMIYTQYWLELCYWSPFDRSDALCKINQIFPITVKGLKLWQDWHTWILKNMFLVRRSSWATYWLLWWIQPTPIYRKKTSRSTHESARKLSNVWLNFAKMPIYALTKTTTECLLVRPVLWELQYDLGQQQSI